MNVIKDNKYRLLQEKMIVAGWEPVELDNVIVFKHRKYGNVTFPCLTIETSKGDNLMFPIASKDNDHEGLACNVKSMASGHLYSLDSNEWHSACGGRRGKRHEKYAKYLKNRQIKKDSFEEEKKINLN